VLWCLGEGILALESVALPPGALAGLRGGRAASCFLGYSGDVAVAGMLLERLAGRNVSEVVSAKEFHDIGYLRDLLSQVCSSCCILALACQEGSLFPTIN
jgi:hypothetical protein